MKTIRRHQKSPYPLVGTSVIIHLHPFRQGRFTFPGTIEVPLVEQLLLNLLVHTLDLAQRLWMMGTGMRLVNPLNFQKLLKSIHPVL